ncbi:non-ribosomal peptide synthetase [Nostoc sp. MG11]|uniref:non-ribosomal peptide synthetase n=1 Tax=Nostoc sp. MG11 TaxID=2721166 RepID=UPI0018668380|nr:non-ribosomal peptide synthetase [Nostoc sp. MG11]
MAIVDKKSNSKNIESIYPLSPMQQGMLFHTLYALETELVYFQQLVCSLHGQLNVSAFQRAWQRVVERHPILRTLFVWENRKQPLQVVRQMADLPWANYDWRRHTATNQEISLSPIEVQERLEAFLQADRNQSFELNQAPLLRCTLIHIANDTYKFLFSHHHLLIDGWSLSTIIQEVFAFYDAFSKGDDLYLKIPRPYEDYISWLQQQDICQAQKFWQQKLKGFTAPTPLTVDKSLKNQEQQQSKYVKQQIQLTEEATNVIQSFVREHQLTINNLIQGAYALLLSHYSGETDVVFGVTVSGRPPALIGVESMVGLFINTLPVRVIIPTQGKLLPWLKDLQTQQIECEQYSYSRLVEIQGWSDLRRGMPLFESIVVFENYPIDASLQKQNNSLDVSNVWGIDNTNYPLNLLAIPGSQLSLGISYDTSRFDAATITRMLGHLQTLLDGFVSNPNQYIWELPYLTADEQNQLLFEWNTTDKDYPQNLCIHELFADQVERTPDAVAVVFEDQQFTYQQLNVRANQLAHYLQNLGVKPDVLVGLCVERSLEMIVGLLGILKAGGAYVPLDPNYPQERLSYTLLDAQVSVLLTQQRLVDKLPEHQGETVCLDENWDAIANFPTDNFHSQVQPTNLAYVLYTSGSTGKPKGVAIEHHSPVALVSWAKELFTSEQLAGVLASTSICFDLSVFELFVPLSWGGKVILAENALHLPTLPAAEQVTLINTVPSAISELIRMNGLPVGVSTVNLAGEALQNQLVQQIYQQETVQYVFNLYGPSEDTTYSTFALIEKGATSAPSIGRAIANTQVYILDQNLQPVPVGVPGELHIGGAGLARGYLNRPELTQEKFIPNPFSQQEGARLYKTGDLARYLPDANIEYLRRIDHQVKIRGFRIELGEIESVLSENPAVFQSVVIAREDTPGDKRLVAYIVLKQEPAPPISELRQFLAQSLPHYMIPGAFVYLEALPLTPNGKIDRRALPAPESRAGIEVALVAPRTPEEKILASIWAEVLRVEKIGIHDNFFELGGDSILSLQIITRTNQAGLQLSPKQLFEHPTIAQLAAVTGTTKKIPAQQTLVTGFVPLTPIQHWFFAQNQPEAHHYNQSVVLKVPQDLNPEILKRLFQELLQHHDALRMRFVSDGETWQQTNAAFEETTPLSVVDLSTIPVAEQAAALENAGNQFQASLNLSTGPLIRAVLFILGNNQPSRLLIIIHHLVVDGVSWRILLDDLQTAYQQLSLGKAIKLPAKTTSFQFWAQRLSEYAQSDTVESELTYWFKKTHNQVPPLPVDYKQGANTVTSIAAISVSLNELETRALLQEVPSAYNTQINDVLLTAVVQVIGKWAGSNSVLLNLEGHGREDIFDDIDLSRTIGWFTTIFPVLLELETSENLGNDLKSVKEQLREIPHKGINYGLLRYLHQNSAITSQLQTSSPVQISFNYLGQFDQTLTTSKDVELTTESIGLVESSQSDRTHLIDINALIIQDKLQIDWTYSSNIHQHATIANLAQEFTQALQALIAHCLSPDAGGYTPTDFPLAKLNQQQLDQALQNFPGRNIEDIYPLSSMQQGMLFHSLYAPESGVYFEQLSCIFKGNLELAAFKQAWQQVINKHSVFRTAFIWENHHQPLQVVYRQVTLPLVIDDRRGLSEIEQQNQLNLFFESEKRHDFELSLAPLMRLNLIQLDADIYQFVWSHHHLLLDGWSLPLVLKQVFELYEAFCEGKNLSLEASANYSNYIAWLQKQDLGQAQRFWQQKLQGFTAPTPLMVDKPLSARQPQSSYNVQEVHLSAIVTASLQAFVKKHQLTLNNVVQGAWSILLSRYSGETDVVFGATVSGRPPDLIGVESMVGLFINTLPVRVLVPREGELLPWLKDLQAQQVESEQYSYTPLVDIQGWSEIKRGMALFESIVVFENYPVDTALQQHNSSLEVVDILRSEQTNYPLTVSAVAGSELSVNISYDAHRFDAGTITRMLRHLQTLLEAIATNQVQRLGELPLLTADEQNQLLFEWNDTQQDYPQDLCVHQLFEQQVESTPDAVAVVFENRQLTYWELNVRANQLAHYLQIQGVKPDVLVGICVERSLEMVVGLLAILKAGGAYLPLDPNYPQERLSYMLSDSQVSVLLTQQRLVDKLPEHQSQILCLDTDWNLICESSAENPVSDVQAANLAYIIYTSGSTGQPKGVLIPHQGLLNLVFWHQRTFEITAKDRATQLAGTAFDASVWELWPYLSAGASIYLVKQDILGSLHGLRDWLISQQVTISFVPTPLAEDLLSLEWHDNCTLRMLLTGGDRLHHYPSAVIPFGLVNNYGPTENTVVTTSGLVANEQQDILPVIGRPISNTQVYVLDPNLQPVPIGVPGELHIGGDSLAKGYLNRPELTQEKFIPNPFNNSKGNERLYKTGDLVRYLADGNIEYLGRIDNQVKIRGFRIELGEVETALSQHPSISQVTVIVREDTQDEQRLVAYLVPSQEPAPIIRELRQFLAQKLPEYMIPAAFVFLETIPLTPNGKVDHRALPVPEIHRELDNFVAPRTPIEEILASIWADVLRVEPIGIYDNFFELGGHSLLATQLVSRIRTTFKIELPLRTLFETAVIANLTEYIQQYQRNISQLSLLPLQPVARDGKIPLSHAQQRLWFLDQLEPNSATYNIPGALRFQGQLNVAALEKSLSEIIRRHEVLRTNFIIQDGEAVQIIRPVASWAMTVINLPDLPVDERELEIQQLAIAEAQQPFDLVNDSLIRVTLLVISQTEHILLFCMHHIVSDGWSMGVFVQEIAELYTAFSQGRLSSLSELAIQYADFAVWQRQWLQGDVKESQLAYWRQQLAEIPALLELPTDRPRPAVQTFQGTNQDFSLSVELTQALELLSRREGVTLFMTLLAAYNTLLYRYTGQADILVGSPIANRNYSEIESLIGFFVNTLVFRTDISGNPTFRELLERVREVSLEAYAHQDLPFELLVEALQPERDLSHTPLFQVMFVFQNAPASDMELPGLTLSSLTADSLTAKFDLTLSFENTNQGLVGAWEYNTDLFDAATITRLAAHFQVLLESIVANPEQRVYQLPLLTANEQHQLLTEWNDTQTKYPQNQCIHELFTAQAERTPDVVAAVFDDQQITYHELNSRANQLAHYLRTLGVNSEMLVGIFVERSVEMVVGLLGILKAGGAYLPLDSDYPQERLSLMLSDSQISVLLTQQQLVERLPEHQAKVVCLDTDWDTIKQENTENLPSEVTANSLAYVIYTSGSTGKPKGVAVPHLAVNRLVFDTNYIQLDASDNIAQAANASFDAATFEIWGAFLHGARLVGVTQKIALSPPEFAAYLREQEISVLFLTTALFNQLASFVPQAFNTLRYLLFGGEAVDPRWVKEVLQNGRPQQLLHVYGPTESTTFSSWFLIEDVSDIATTIPIGQPISNTQIYLLDQNLQLVPVGVSGELHIGGDGLAQGYLNRPELTQEKFIPNPFNNSKLYKTGDLGRYLPDGNIEYLARIDNQVKIRGFRIELGEIELALLQHPDIREVVVLAREDVVNERRLVAYLIFEPNQTSSIGELRTFLQGRLPNYMVPAAFVFLEQFPLTPNGKIDRYALPIFDLSAQFAASYVAPNGKIEEAIADIWQEVLQLEKVGVDDNFFDLGGHSLLMVKLSQKLQEHFHRNISLLEIFKYPTISTLAKHLSSQQSDSLLELEKRNNQIADIKAGRNRLKQRLTRSSKEVKND